MSDIPNLADRRARSDERAAFRPMLAFDTDHLSEEAEREFVRGYEAGAVDRLLREVKPETFRGTYHASNREMFRRVCAACGYDLTIEATTDPTWIFVDFTRRPTLEVVR